MGVIECAIWSYDYHQVREGGKGRKEGERYNTIILTQNFNFNFITIHHQQENHYGYYQVFYTIIGILADTIKRTISRVLLLAVSMGYGVVKPTLGSDGYKVSYLIYRH